MTKKQYIPEIDSLRALAVLMVVVYHAMPQLAPGGYIGVDVFFVISGYVIARSYLEQLVANEISVSQFYLARFRRLAPAVFLVLLVSTLFAGLVLTPNYLINYAHSLIAQPFYAQNFVFWYIGDYFEQALTRPLLHTWSLAVEEQFYILLALAILLFRRSAKLLVPVIICVALLSLLIGYALEVRSPKTVFYLLPTRIWEFCFGIGVFLLAARCPIGTKSFPSVVALSGVGLVLASGLFFDHRSAFPGPQAFMACIGTAIMLYVFDRHSRATSSVFRLAPLRYVGRISYGFYLWHWPPLAFFYLYFDRVATLPEAVSLMALAFAMASLSYHFVENPIRTAARLPSRRQVITMVLGGSLATIFAAGFLITTRGLAFRYPPEIQTLYQAPSQRGTFRCGKVFVALNPSAEMCLINAVNEDAPAVLLLGDSHADILKEMLGRLGNDLGNRIYLTTRNCDLGTYGNNAFCSEAILDELIEEAQSKGITSVIAISYWNPRRMDPAALRDDLEQLRDAGFNLAIMETVPTDPSYDPLERAKYALHGRGLVTDGITATQFEAQIAPLREVLDIATVDMDVTRLQPHRYFCDDTACEYWQDGAPLYFDSNHLTFSGAERLRPMFERLLRADDQMRALH